MEIKVVYLKSSIVSLREEIVKCTSKSGFFLFIDLAEQVEDVNVAVSLYQVVCVLVQCHRVLLPVVLERDFRRLLRLLRPEEWD